MAVLLHLGRSPLRIQIINPNYFWRAAPGFAGSSKFKHEVRCAEYCRWMTKYIYFNYKLWPMFLNLLKIYIKSLQLFKHDVLCAGWRRRPSPAEAPPIGKIHHFGKMAVTFEPQMGFWCPSGFREFLITMN